VNATPLGRPDGQPAVHEEPARGDDAAGSRPDGGARLPGQGGAHGPGLQTSRSSRRPTNDALRLRQGVRQPRAVQPDVLHRREPREVPHRARRARRPSRPPRSSTSTSSSRRAPAAPAASACTPPSTARRCATAGFDGFRVMLFQQKGGLQQATGEEAGLAMNPGFFLGLLKAIIAGDVINGMGLPPAAVRARGGCHGPRHREDEGLGERPPSWAAAQCWRRCCAAGASSRTSSSTGTRPAPRVSIIGEFWGHDDRGATATISCSASWNPRAPSATSSS